MYYDEINAPTFTIPYDYVMVTSHNDLCSDKYWKVYQDATYTTELNSWITINTTENFIITYPEPEVDGTTLY